MTNSVHVRAYNSAICGSILMMMMMMMISVYSKITREPPNRKQRRDLNTLKGEYNRKGLRETGVSMIQIAKFYKVSL